MDDLTGKNFGWGTNDRGIALIQIIIIGAALFGLTTTALLVSREDGMISNNIVNGTKAFWGAASGTEIGKNWLEVAANQADPCIENVSNPCTLGPTSLGDEQYAVTIARWAPFDPRVRITSTGTGPNLARKVVEEIILMPFFNGNDGLVQIDGAAIPSDLERPGAGGPGFVIPSWTIDGTGRHAADLSVDPNCAPAPPVGGVRDDSNTGMPSELDRLKCGIVQRANECCVPPATEGGPWTTGTAAQAVPGACLPGVCETDCTLGTCTLGQCAPGTCNSGSSCYPGECSVADCNPGSCAPGNASCAGGACVVDVTSCQPGSCSDTSCTAATCAVGTCTEGTCAPNSPDCVPGWCKNQRCSPGGTCNGNGCTTATCPVDRNTCAPGVCNNDQCTAGICEITSCAAGGCAGGSTCVAAACSASCAAGDSCSSGSCVDATCPATCAAGENCTVDGLTCVSGTCGLPQSIPICTRQICTTGYPEEESGLKNVYGPGAQPQYQTPYYDDLILGDQSTAPPPEWAGWALQGDCDASAANCCKAMSLADPALRPAAPGNYQIQRGPLIADTADPNDNIPVDFLSDATIQGLRMKIETILDVALRSTGTKYCITTGQISGGTAVYGTLDTPAITIVSTPQDQNPKVAQLSTSPPCTTGPGDGVNNLVLKDGAIVQGAGVLILPRELDIQDATFDWKGLIVILENGKIWAKQDACGGICGGLLLQTNNDRNNARLELDANVARSTCGAANGAFSINHCCDALDKANQLLMETVSWSELFG